MQIPDEPKIPLDNYLLDLTDKEDAKVGESERYHALKRLAEFAGA
jgi:hypothetical protein